MRTCVVGLLSALVFAVPGAVAASKSRVIDRTSVDGWRVSPTTTYLDALQRFGPLRPPSVSASVPSRALCRLVSRPLGLTLDFEAIPGPAEPSRCKFFMGATATGVGWRTLKGLHIGSSLRTLRSLYPSAWDGGLVKPLPGVPNWAADWALTQTHGHALQPVLTARVAHSRVVAIGIEMVGH